VQGQLVVPERPFSPLHISQWRCCQYHPVLVELYHSHLGLQTIRVKYEPTDNAGMEIGDVVRVAIFLGRGQVDMAVEPHGVEQVNQHFTILNCSRFSKLDPLFVPEPCHDQV
jgi:hypothetical protein